MKGGGGRKLLLRKGGFEARTGTDLLCVEGLSPGVVKLLDIPSLIGRGSGTRGRRSCVFLAFSRGILVGSVVGPAELLLTVGG